MSMEEINQLLTQMRKVSHQANGEAAGIVSDTMTNILTTVGQKMAAMQVEIDGLKKELESNKTKKQ
jgi:gas vesicle protein